MKRVKLGVSSHFLENAWGNGLKYGMLVYPDHLQNWLDYGYGMVIFPVLVLFWLSETGLIWGFQAFSGNPSRKWPEILHADVSWPLLELIRLCLQFVGFYTPVWKTGRIMPWRCPSVRIFRAFLQHALRYQFETWYIHSVGSMTCRVWFASQLGHFDLVYSQK